MRHLFDADLEYGGDQAAEISSEDREGEYIGSGIGRIMGERLNGTIRWSMFAADCTYLLVRAGIEPGPAEELCRVHSGDVIETDDGARIQFDARGYGLRGVDSSQPHLWHLTAALHFATQDARYRWLNTTLGLWEGIFDERTDRACARYSAYGTNGTNGTLESVAGSPAREGDTAMD
jgi:hypothetical protein